MVERVGMVLTAGVCLILGACDFTNGAADKPPADTETGLADTSNSGNDATIDIQPEPEDVDVAETGTAKVASTKKSDIDWDTARRDLASSNERDTTFNIQSGSSAPPVPVLLPTGPVRPASADGPQPQFRPVPDGYFAVFPGDRYNLIVNGTNEVTDVPGGSAGEGGSEDMRYVETSTGAMVSFSRYGADYMVEFECLGSGAEGGSCITEDEAMSVAEEIVISGTQ
ncbi:hypothetical protein [Henriciella sp.]|uniref:hypothetical protein n=1 Tax=Henriciella sp. TaxID=1968823 RepID=UPI00260C1F2B|nr:hypothetical protein [Henriciella sp.]